MTEQTIPHFPNQLKPDLLGVTALNPWPGHDSSSRAAMMSSHIGQALVVKGADIRRCQTGVEREYAQHTFRIEMPCNALIIKCIQKYPATLGVNDIGDNPVTSVIYEDTETKEIGVLDLTKFHWLHQHYGFHYKYNRSVLEKLVPNSYIPKGTVIADSPSVTENGDYKYGVETQIALMSYQPVIEDGVIASESYLKKLTTTAYGSRIVSWGKDFFPLNVYGNDKVYQPFPNIGQRIRDDELVFALRKYDEYLAPAQMTPKKLQEVSYLFDRPYYGIGGAKVIDVIVHKGSNPKSNMPSGMVDQTNMYFKKEFTYYSSLLETERSLFKKRGETLRISKELHQLLVEARAFTDDYAKSKISKTRNRNPLDEWTVEIIFEYESVPTIGSKITDLHGG